MSLHRQVQRTHRASLQMGLALLHRLTWTERTQPSATPRRCQPHRGALTRRGELMLHRLAATTDRFTPHASQHRTARTLSSQNELHTRTKQWRSGSGSGSGASALRLIVCPIIVVQ